MTDDERKRLQTIVDEHVAEWNADEHVNECDKLKHINVTDINSFMQWARDCSWDLESCLLTLSNELDQLESDDVQFGSCTNYIQRLCAQCVAYYGASVESFNNWDT